MDDKFLIQTDNIELIKEIGALRTDLTKEIGALRTDLTKEITDIRKLIDTNFKWGVGMFISILITLFVLLFKSFT